MTQLENDDRVFDALDEIKKSMSDRERAIFCIIQKLSLYHRAKNGIGNHISKLDEMVKLSVENNLPVEEIETLRTEALAAFQTLQKSLLEELSACGRVIAETKPDSR